ncbi:hypothetical protein [Solimonas terrae]|uniref:hypothetical protein n=1 Tax=Solimonas terrae TaxID=1396819 RepID=UPI003450A635
MQRPALSVRHHPAANGLGYGIEAVLLGDHEPDQSAGYAPGDGRPVTRARHGISRYRLHASRLLGRPDLIFRKRRKAIFVHGCVWRAHAFCPLARIPKSRTAFWEGKFTANKARHAGARRSSRRWATKCLQSGNAR